jgi:signal transduction histidine kinase
MITARAKYTGSMELLIAEQAGSIAMDVISILCRKGQVVSTYELAVVRRERADRPSHVPERIEISHRLSGPLLTTEAVRGAIELSATRYRSGSLVPGDAKVEIHHAFRIQRPSDHEETGQVVAGRAAREPARLEDVAEAIQDPLIVYDASLRATYANRAALRLFGRSVANASIEEWGRLPEPRDQRGEPLPLEEWPQLRAQSEALRRRMMIRVPLSGRDLIVDVEAAPIRGSGCVLMLRDVGKEEDERQRLSQFVSFVAHELRNPLAVAKARIELARRDPSLSERAAVHAARAFDSVDAAISILGRLELFSRADAGCLEARNDRFELAAAIDASVEQLRARGSDRQVTVDVRGSPVAVGDRHLAEQAITNLLTNADRYSVSDAAIRIEVTGGPGAVTLRVIDGGPGIAEELVDHLFRNRVASGRGLGLGLYLVNAMMVAQGGSADLEQARPNAVFALRWTAAAAERSAAERGWPRAIDLPTRAAV